MWLCIWVAVGRRWQADCKLALFSSQSRKQGAKPGCKLAHLPACPQLQSNEQYLRLKQIEVEKQHRERGLLPAASGSNGADSEAALAQQELQHGQAEPPGSPQQQQEGLPMQQRRPAGESPR